MLSVENYGVLEMYRRDTGKEDRLQRMEFFDQQVLAHSLRREFQGHQHRLGIGQIMHIRYKSKQLVYVSETRNADFLEMLQTMLHVHSYIFIVKTHGDGDTLVHPQ